MSNWTSPSADRALRTIRNELARIIVKNSVFKDDSIDNITRRYSQQPIANMIVDAYLIGQFLLNETEVKEQIEQDPEYVTYINKYTESLTNFWKFQSRCVTIAPHHVLITKANSLLLDTRENVENRLSDAKFCDEFNTAVNSYAETLLELFDSNVQSDGTLPPSFLKDLAIWKTTTDSEPIYVNTPDDSNVAAQHQAAMVDFSQTLVDKDVSDLAVAQVLIPDFCHAGTDYPENSSFPFYVPILPISHLLKHRDQIWNERMSAKHSNPLDRIEPAELEELDLHIRLVEEYNEISFTESIEVPKRNKRIQPSPEPSLTDEPEDEKARSRAQSIGLRPSSRQSSTPVTSSRSPPPATPSELPLALEFDDSNYTPDPFLSRKCRGITDAIQSLPQMDLKHDHMTRFELSFERPIPLTKWQVRKSDIRIFQGQSILSRMYVVTYSRKSRKPLFNPVD